MQNIIKEKYQIIQAEKQQREHSQGDNSTSKGKRVGLNMPYACGFLAAAKHICDIK